MFVHPAVIQFANLLHLEYNVPLTMARALTQLLLLQFLLAMDELADVPPKEQEMRRHLIVEVTNDAIRAYMKERGVPRDVTNNMLVWMYERAGEAWRTIGEEYERVGGKRRPS